MQQFEAQHGFPGVLGAIDGTHIPITAPSKDQAAYCNRHQHHSIILQAICDANYKFIDVFAGYAGSVHDARVFYNSPIAKIIQETPWVLFPNSDCHILGDSAYKCTTYVLTPYRDNGHLTQKQKNYNYRLSATRVCIEQCFALLKCRFRILKHVNVYNTIFIPKIILAYCVLHNICMTRKDSIEINEVHINDDTEYRNLENDKNGNTKRNFICDKLT
ncbi:hypothetical protein RN001_005480 [Aquatica leii]|uniref:DDE Tnp4 domain-containing protein n=1 Tax=Aquatica leii TaxID=1421715 RepID=A0AAN7PH13_9COLE|nr:hypothetical protein RN001_005480 [Aquatica leii]